MWAQMWAEQVFWWIPTKDDQVKYRQDELESIKNEYMEVLSKLVAFGEEIGNAEDKLVSTFSWEQRELWLNLKSVSQKAHFQTVRKNHMDERIKEIPKEINELLTPQE